MKILKIVNLQSHKMFRILLIISLILLAVPLINKALNYTKDKAHDAKVAGEDASRTIKATGKVMKEVAKEIPQRIKEESDKK